MESYIVVIFFIGYLVIALEQQFKVNKTAVALVTGIICWTLFAITPPTKEFFESKAFISVTREFKNLSPAELYPYFIKTELSDHLSQIASILFFLMGAMTIVELIDSHNGFNFITDQIKTRSERGLLWIICWVAFFLSAVMDNLTTAIVMVSLVRKLVHEKERRFLFGGMIIIAANAGGVWSPIGDVTTTMLWIGGQISSTGIIKTLLAPSIISLLVPLMVMSFRLNGNLNNETSKNGKTLGVCSTGGKVMLFSGIGVLLSVPVFKTFTHLPPYMGMLFGLGVLWIISEVINPGIDEEEKQKYSAASALSRIDISSVLFFFGILLAVSALESMQTLHHFAQYLSNQLGDNRIIISLIGVVSAIVDNVPLVAACMGMYPIEIYGTDHMIWQYLSFCAGTGGSLLIIGSAAGVVVMGMEKMDFVWYLKKISFLALLGYVGGALCYLLLYASNL